MKSPSPRICEKAPAQVCAIFPGALGDFICFLPALQILRQAAPLDLYACSEFCELVPEGVTVRSLESPEIGALFQPESAEPASAMARWHSYDALYSWHGSGNPDVVRRLQKITAGRSRCFPFRPVEVTGHQADYYLSCVGGGKAVSVPGSIALREDAIRWRERFWAEHGLDGRPVLALAPGSGAREKNWPAESFLAVVEWWRRAAHGEALLLTGPVERERGGLGRLCARCIDAGQLSLAQIAAVLARSLVYLGNDSGVSHLAGALGVRTVVFFGPSNPLQWAPRGGKVVVLRRGLDCSPCNDDLMKSCSHHGCLRKFAPREAIETLARLPELVTLTR